METLKRQKAKVGVSGSFINQLMANNSSLPVVGKGATKLHYSDRTCYEVVEVSEDGKTAKLEKLNARHDSSKEGGIGHQNWILEPSGYFTTVVWRNNAWKVRYEKVQFTKEYWNSIKNLSFKENRKLNSEKGIFVEGEIHLQYVEGYTEKKVKYDKISLIFGVKDYYYDWEF